MTKLGVAEISGGLQPPRVQMTGKDRRISLFPVPVASIRCLRGAELAVMQVNSNQQICAQFDFQNNLPLQVRPDGGRVSEKGSKLHFLVHGFVSSFTCHTATLLTERYRLVRVDQTVKALRLRPAVVSSLFYTCM